MANIKASQRVNTDKRTATNSALPAVERHLGLIKAMAIIMAVLIFAALLVIIITIYSRLTNLDTIKNVQAHEMMIPRDSHAISANLTEKGQVLLLIEDATGQQLWQVDPSGKVRRKTRFLNSP